MWPVNRGKRPSPQDLTGRIVVGMVNLDDQDNEFLLLGFEEDGLAVPLSCDAVGPDLPPNGSRLL